MARPELYEVAMDAAMEAAGSHLIRGRKSVSSVQAYILLALYARNVQPQAEDRAWMYSGLAIRFGSLYSLRSNCSETDAEWQLTLECTHIQALYTTESTEIGTHTRRSVEYGKHGGHSSTENRKYSGGE